ncbi:hypothetical protein SMF913_27660 [Streptomyces malaysiensis]|uniref:Uncharacterized protein n=1 Tax=Streptomyces malaysiensis TaxID=92644 RepID=A0A2J7YVZ4_STRMQ|nr:hypothetical protein SMF913_27660 [Streptomyces malaysiensis]
MDARALLRRHDVTVNTQTVHGADHDDQNPAVDTATRRGR